LGTGSARFVGITTLLTWREAQAYCRTHYTDLAISYTSSDNTLLGQIQDAQGYSWIGLYRDTWKWSDGTVSAFPWAPGQITNYYGRLDCAMASNGQYSQDTCTNPHYFYCYT
ncbi:macrophage mannose receptor 1-like isoform X6, partial [Clarias magur]